MANITITSTPVAISQLEPWRERYFSELREAQEPLLETLVAASSAYLVQTRDAAIGYALVHPDRGIFEYYLDRSEWAFSTEIFGKLLRQRDITRGLVKSFDDLFMAAAMDHQCGVTSLGMLVRDYVPRPLPPIESLAVTCTLATRADQELIDAVDQDVFSDPQRLADAVENGYVWLYRADVKCKTVVGFGLIKPVRAGSLDVDVGIAIDGPFRNKGFALYVMQDLMSRSIAAGYRPIAGCALDNLASRRMGQRIGMAPRYRLLCVNFRAAR